MGLFSSLVGRRVPGFDLLSAHAEGNALGRGPVLLHLPDRLLRVVKDRAAAGDEEMRDLLVQAYRQVATQVRRSLPAGSMCPGFWGWIGQTFVRRLWELRMLPRMESLGKEALPAGSAPWPRQTPPWSNLRGP
jgi:hypothetical protein